MRFTVRTAKREELVDITREVADFVTLIGVEDGAVLVFCPHTTAGITINEDADPDVCRDLVDGLARIAPCDAGWRHAEGNSDAHIKASLVGPSVLVPVETARMVLGTWQGIYLAEFDGPRTRTVDVTLLPGVR
ncbi:MAG TPA: secondary thiamine-phosphate synthase enzyme YjbQ [Coriobacteriia bacterium]|nr:secondary thiamine-phosphate synthase enzyme YjbQ [Coriobacteriia bacterium]